MNSQGFAFVPAAIWSECNFFVAERCALKVLVDIPFAGKGIDEGLLALSSKYFVMTSLYSSKSDEPTRIVRGDGQTFQ